MDLTTPEGHGRAIAAARAGKVGVLLNGHPNIDNAIEVIEIVAAITAAAVVARTEVTRLREQLEHGTPPHLVWSTADLEASVALAVAALNQRHEVEVTRLRDENEALVGLLRVARGDVAATVKRDARTGREGRGGLLARIDAVLTAHPERKP